MALPHSSAQQWKNPEISVNKPVCVLRQPLDFLPFLRLSRLCKKLHWGSAARLSSSELNKLAVMCRAPSCLLQPGTGCKSVQNVPLPNPTPPLLDLSPHTPRSRHWGFFFLTALLCVSVSGEQGSSRVSAPLCTTTSFSGSSNTAPVPLQFPPAASPSLYPCPQLCLVEHCPASHQIRPAVSTTGRRFFLQCPVHQPVPRHFPAGSASAPSLAGRQRLLLPISTC